MFSRGTENEVTTLVTSSFRHLNSVSKPSSATRLPSRSSTATYGGPYSVDFPTVSSTSCPSRKSWSSPAFTGIAILKPGRVGETHNNRLKLTARGRSVAESRLRTRAAA